MNKETLQNYNTRLNENNTNLTEVLNMINELPEAGTGEVIDMYSTEETKTNKVWINGKPIYRKVVDCGALPNTGKKQIAHGIKNVEMFVGYSAIATNGETTFFLSLASPVTAAANIYVIESGANIEIMTGNDRSSFTTCYVTLEYTKTTD